jgi:cell division protease FtsH
VTRPCKTSKQKPSPSCFWPGGVQVKELVERAYRRAKDLVQSNIGILHKTAEVLLEKEQIDGEEFLKIVESLQAEQYLKQDEPSVTVPYQTA